MSAFALPMPPAGLAADLHRPTERSATTSEDRDQESGIRTAAGEALQHAGDLRVLALPALSRLGPDIAEITSVKGPYLHLVGRADRHHDKAMELGARLTLLAEPFGNIGTDRFRRSPDLIGQRELLDPREFEAHPVHLQRQPISPPKHLEVLKSPCPFTHF